MRRMTLVGVTVVIGAFLFGLGATAGATTRELPAEGQGGRGSGQIDSDDNRPDPGRSHDSGRPAAVHGR